MGARRDTGRHDPIAHVCVRSTRDDVGGLGIRQRDHVVCPHSKRDVVYAGVEGEMAMAEETSVQHDTIACGSAERRYRAELELRIRGDEIELR